MSDYFVTDEAGLPLGMVNMDQVQADGTAMSYALAAAAGDRDELDRVADEWLERVGSSGFGYVAAVAARQLAEGVVAPLLDVLDATRAATGVPTQDLRVGLSDAAEFAMAVSATIRASRMGGGES